MHFFIGLLASSACLTCPATDLFYQNTCDALSAACISGSAKACHQQNRTKCDQDLMLQAECLEEM